MNTSLFKEKVTRLFNPDKFKKGYIIDLIVLKKTAVTYSNNDLPTMKGDLLKYIQKGVLWIEKKPYYIVELIKEENLAYVMVYKVHPGTEKNPQKLAQEVVDNKPRFSNQTRLGQLANAMFPLKAIKKWVPYPPAFVAPVIPNKPNTFTGKFESGFFEREEDRVIVEGGEKKIIRGKNTGVFIGLSSIDWEDKITIPTQSVLEVLKGYKEAAFYDFEQGSDSNNPLSRYYNGN